MSKIRKILAVVLAVIMIMPFAMSAASAASPAAPEFKVSLVSETDTTVVVKFSLAKGSFNALDFTIYTSSAIKECTKIENTKSFNELVADYIMNKDALITAISNPTAKKASVITTVSFSGSVDIFNITFSKKNSTPIKNTDIGIVIDNCAVTVNTGASGETNVIVTDDVKVAVSLMKFNFNETSIAMNYKDSRTVDVDTNYPASQLTWSSSNENVVKVDENGNLVATGKGTATITVTSADGQVNETCEVTVSYTIIQWIIIIVLFGWIWY